MGQINPTQKELESKDVRKKLYIKSDSSESNKHYIKYYFFLE